MIKTTVAEVLAGHKALRRINEEVRLPQKAAWRVARLLNKMKPIVESFSDTQVKMFRDAGGRQSDVGVVIDDPVRGDNEKAGEWKARLDEHRESINKLSDHLKELGKEAVEIDYDPIPLALFEDDERVPLEKRRQLSANDLADAAAFFAE